MSNDSPRTSFFSPRRAAIIAGNTFTHLVRMKVFYFLLVFALLTIGIHLLPELPHLSGPESSGSEELRQVKSFLVAIMKLFAIILAIVATALLIPRDLEDRTLYTILSKPVTRLDYLVGKLVGVLALIFVGLVVMTVLLDGVLHYRTQMVLAEVVRFADGQIDIGAYTEVDKQDDIAVVMRQGVTWSLQAAILTIFLEATIMAALALLISTFSSSTLFTVVVSTLCYFIGLFIANAKDYWDSQVRGHPMLEEAANLIFVIFPNFRPYGISDQAIAGQYFPPEILGHLALTAGLYVGIYIVLSWFVFSDKEF